jgi:steroid 5-alpha reductase family enzyme
MTFFDIYLQALVAILVLMTALWVVSVIIRNVSIVDLFWGAGFVLTGIVYYNATGSGGLRKVLLMTLVAIWGFRLSLYLTWRNRGKGEDFRYRAFRKKYGEDKYWWISYFQVFLLQGLLMWLISAPLLGAQFYGNDTPLGALDLAGAILWAVGLLFEAGGDYQLARFKADPANRGGILNAGFWKYTRHPNYFGDSAVWWGFGLICFAAGSWIPALGSVLMTALIVKVSGVALLDKSLTTSKPGYANYVALVRAT